MTSSSSGGPPVLERVPAGPADRHRAAGEQRDDGAPADAVRAAQGLALLASRAAVSLAAMRPTSRE